MSPTAPVLVSACIIARDEERTIGQCIRSLRPLVDDVVLVDTGSRDRTAVIAAELGARVYEHPWQYDFSLHRNQSIEAARGRWILVVDADEVVEPSDFGDTRGRLAGDGLPRVLMVRHWSTYPGGVRVVEYLPRLFRNEPDIRYVHPLHEQLTVTAEEAILSNVVLRHSGYNDASRLLNKQQRNHELSLRMSDNEPHTQHCRMRALVGLGRWEDATRSASALLALEAAPDDLRFEAHVVLAVSAFRMEQPSRAEFLEHVDHARALHPHASDVAYLELMRAAGAYLRTLDLANNPGNLEFLRIGQFWHMAEPVRELVRALALPESAHPRRGQALPADVAPARPAPEAGPTPGKQRKGASWKRPSSSVTGRR